MEHQQYQKRRVAEIRVEPYLARYARQKFEVEPRTGGIIIPDSLDLYHCVWSVMSRRPLGAADPEGCNLRIWLPFRRSADGVPCKHPAYWNYISPRNARFIEKALRRLFNWEFHYWCEDLVARGSTKKEAVDRFISRYDLGLDCEDALLKNLQRHERTIQVFLGISKKKNAKK